jgi:hypothetical protein
VLIADQVVVNEGFEGPSTGPIEEWVKKNAKALMTSDYGPISKSTDCGVSKKKSGQPRSVPLLFKAPIAGITVRVWIRSHRCWEDWR